MSVFSTSLLRLLGVVVVLTGAANPAWAGARDILYFDWQAATASGEPSETTLDQLAAVEAVLDENERGRLFVGRVRDDKTTRFGVLYRVPDDGADAAALVKAHQKKLAAALDAEESAARLVERRSYGTVFNISYGLGKNFDALKKSWALVGKVLGPKLARRLYIEKTDYGNYALVYKRYGTSRATRDVARVHSRLLRRYRVGASLIKERNNRIVWDGTGSSDDDADRAPDEERPDDTLARKPASTEKDRPKPIRLAMAGRTKSAAARQDPAAKKVAAKPARVDKKDATPKRPGPARGSKGAGLRPGTSALEGQIERVVKKLRQASRVAAVENTSWLVYDLHKDRTLASINIDAPRQAASMIKPFIMLAYFHQVKKKRLPYRGIHKARLRAMIQHSSNTATDWFLRLLGGPRKVQALLSRSYGHLLRSTSVVEYIGRAGQTYRNRASAADYGRFLRALWRNRLPHASTMRRIMNLPGRDRLYHGAKHVPSGTAVYDKTGTTAKLCGDMGLLVARTKKGGKLPYIVVGIVERPTRTKRYFSWMATRGDVIRRVSDTAYLYLKKRYGLR